MTKNHLAYLNQEKKISSHRHVSMQNSQNHLEIQNGQDLNKMRNLSKIYGEKQAVTPNRIAACHYKQSVQLGNPILDASFYNDKDNKRYFDLSVDRSQRNA